MKHIPAFVLSLVFAVMFLSSCGKKSDAPGGGDSTRKSSDSAKPASTPSAANAARYPMKSGIIHGETETMGMKTTTAKYFDDYGALEADETMSTIKMGGTTISTHKLRIRKNEMMYDIDLEKKTGRQMNLASASGFAGIDFKNMSEQVMKDMGIKQIGTETIAGKECKVFEMTDASKGAGMTGKVWVWGPAALKMDMANGNMKITQTTTSIEENPSIPADKFEVPKDVVMKEVDMKTGMTKAIPK